MSIKPDAERALRDAMARLFDGQSRRTDGKLTWNNVFTEAGVPRATAARAAEVILEWKDALRQRGASGAPPVPAEEAKALKASLEQRSREAAATHRALRETIRTMANHIQALTLALEQKDALIASMGSKGDKVVPLRGAKA